MENITIRKIEFLDNKEVADVVRTSLAEFGLDKPGTVYFDDTTDHLYELFQHPGSFYFVAEQEGKIVGGAGIYPSDGLAQGTCELVKMYLRPAARGKGLGGMLIDKCLEIAKGFGYIHVYLETMPELKKAVSVYQKFGFEHLDGPLGNTGHYFCDVWMLKELGGL
jgi:putative acetyltransferase